MVSRNIPRLTRAQRASVEAEFHLLLAERLVIVAAKRWSAFQTDDSRADQVLDGRLAREAARAKAALLEAIEKLP